MVKKIVSTMLCAVLSAAMVVPCFATEAVETDEQELLGNEMFTWYYEKIPGTDNEVRVVGYSSDVPPRNVHFDYMTTIPDETEMYLVTAIGDGLFKCTGSDKPVVESVDMATVSTEEDYRVDIKHIGVGAFENNTKLESVKFNPDVKVSIGDGAFYNCNQLKLENIENFSSISSIGKQAFAYCEGFEGVLEIPDGVKEIGDYAFMGCKNLNSVIIPDSVERIGVGAFYRCTSLQNVIMSDSVKIIDEKAFDECSSLLGINIPNSVETIGKLAFWSCKNLKMVSFGSSLKTIGDTAFGNCKMLKCKLVLPESVTSIGEYAFQQSGISEITLPSKVTKIASGTFFDCGNLKKVNGWGHISSIGDNAFTKCEALESVKLSDSITSIDSDTFYACTGLKEIRGARKVTSVAKNAFTGGNPEVTTLLDVNASTAMKNYDWLAADRKVSYKDFGYDPEIDPAPTKTPTPTITPNPTKTPDPTKAPTPIPKSGFAIRFDGNKATSGSMADLFVKKGVSKELTKNAYKRKGYTFTGWNTEANGKGTSYKNSEKIKNLAKGGKTITLYAQWKANKYNIKFSANGGKGKMSALKNVTYGKKKALTKNKFKKKGYKFAGWATSKKNAKKGKVAYKNKAKVKNLTSAKGKTVTLYAVWKKTKK